MLKIFDSETKDPTNTGQVLCTLCRERAERTASRPRTAKTQKGALRTNTPHPGATSHRRRERAHSLPFPSLPKPSLQSTHHQRHAGSGTAQGDPSRAQTLATTIPVGGATSTKRGSSCPSRGVSRFAILLRTSIPSFDGLPGQSRRNLRLDHML